MANAKVQGGSADHRGLTADSGQLTALARATIQALEGRDQTAAFAFFFWAATSS